MAAISSSLTRDDSSPRGATEGVLIGRVAGTIIPGTDGRMLALGERLHGPSTDHSAEGLLDGAGARRVPPNARPSLPLRVPPTAGFESVVIG